LWDLTYVRFHKSKVICLIGRSAEEAEIQKQKNKTKKSRSKDPDYLPYRQIRRRGGNTKTKINIKKSKSKDFDSKQKTKDKSPCLISNEIENPIKTPEQSGFLISHNMSKMKTDRFAERRTGQSE
jgi:hypothetical protein